jgi:hypothetical protein
MQYNAMIAKYMIWKRVTYIHESIESILSSLIRSHKGGVNLFSVNNEE